jgi:hypothetical protein
MSARPCVSTCWLRAIHMFTAGASAAQFGLRGPHEPEKLVGPKFE